MILSCDGLAVVGLGRAVGAAGGDGVNQLAIDGVVDATTTIVRVADHGDLLVKIDRLTLGRGRIAAVQFPNVLY